MRAVRIEQLRANHVVARPLLDEDGRVLLNYGVRLTAKYIQALKDKGYTHLYVREEADESVDVAPAEDLDPSTRARALRSLRQTFDAVEGEVHHLRAKSLAAVSDACSSGAMGDLLGNDTTREMMSIVNAILKEALNHDVLAGLASMEASDMRLQAHCLDVATTAIMIGRGVGLHPIRMQQLAMGCLLHDIGMAFLDSALDENTRLRQHALLGYDLLRNSPNADILAPRIALEHHERQDGTGVPKGLVGSNTIERDRTKPPPIPTLIGEIAAVANAYVNLINGTPSAEPMSSDRALAAIGQMRGATFNSEVVRAFFQIAPVYPMASTVVVTSGEFRLYSGTVARVHPDRLDRPTIVLTKDKVGEPIPPTEINLKEFPDITIRSRQSDSDL